MWRVETLRRNRRPGFPLDQRSAFHSRRTMFAHCAETGIVSIGKDGGGIGKPPPPSGLPAHQWIFRRLYLGDQFLSFDAFPTAMQYTTRLRDHRPCQPARGTIEIVIADVHKLADAMERQEEQRSGEGSPGTDQAPCAPPPARSGARTGALPSFCRTGLGPAGCPAPSGSAPPCRPQAPRSPRDPQGPRGTGVLLQLPERSASPLKGPSPSSRHPCKRPRPAPAKPAVRPPTLSTPAPQAPEASPLTDGYEPE